MSNSPESAGTEPLGPSAWVVVESMWGNTRAVGDAIARGLGGGTTVVDVADARVGLPAGVSLLVVGGPTHAFSMSRTATRRDAVQHGAAPGHERRGIREWLDHLPKTAGVTDGFYNNWWRYVVDYDAAVKELPPPGGQPHKAKTAMY